MVCYRHPPTPQKFTQNHGSTNTYDWQMPLNNQIICIKQEPKYSLEGVDYIYIFGFALYKGLDCIYSIKDVQSHHF